MKNLSEIADQTIVLESDFASVVVNQKNKTELALAILDLASEVTTKVIFRNKKQLFELIRGYGLFKRAKGSIVLYADDKQLKDMLYVICSIALARRLNANHRDYHFYNSNHGDEAFTFVLKIEDGLYKFDEVDGDSEFARFAAEWDKARQ